MMETDLNPVCYCHYRGHDYQVPGMAWHRENGEQLVACRCLYGDTSLWMRLLATVAEKAMIDGCAVSRYVFISGGDR